MLYTLSSLDFVRNAMTFPAALLNDFLVKISVFNCPKRQLLLLFLLLLSLFCLFVESQFSFIALWSHKSVINYKALKQARTLRAEQTQMQMQIRIQIQILCGYGQRYNV